MVVLNFLQSNKFKSLFECSKFVYWNKKKNKKKMDKEEKEEERAWEEGKSYG